MNTLPAMANFLKRTILLLFISLLAFASTTAQAQTLTIGSVQACAAPEVLVPVTGTDLTNIGSFTLFISFDSTKLVYKSLENIDAQIKEVISYTLDHNPLQLAIVWSGVNPVNFNGKKLFDIKFTYPGATTSVSFKPNCEVTNVNLEIIPVTYKGGSVTSGLPIINRQPSDTVVRPMGTALFRTNAYNVTSYQWKVSKDNGQTWSDLSENDIYRGTLTNELSVQQVPLSYNSFRYSCSLNEAFCPATTQEATLRVDSLASVQDLTGTNDIALQIRPNPVSDHVFMEYNLAEGGLVSLEIMDICGNIVARPFRDTQTKGFHSIGFDVSGLPHGLYLCRVVVNNDLSGHSACRKMIKQTN